MQDWPMVAGPGFIRSGSRAETIVSYFQEIKEFTLVAWIWKQYKDNSCERWLSHWPKLITDSIEILISSDWTLVFQMLINFWLVCKSGKIWLGPSVFARSLFWHLSFGNSDSLSALPVPMILKIYLGVIRETNPNSQTNNKKTRAAVSLLDHSFDIWVLATMTACQLHKKKLFCRSIWRWLQKHTWSNQKNNK